MKKLPLAALAAAIWLAAAPSASAQDMDQNVAYCDNSSNQYPADLVVRGCSAVIQSGRFGNEILGIAYFNRANAFYDLRNFSAAVADYDQVIRLKPDEGNAYGNRATAYRAMGDFTRALADYDRALALRPHPLDFKNRGDLYADLGDHGRAVTDYSQALAYNTQDYALLLARANSYSELGDAPAAEADYRQASALIPANDPGANNDLCWALAVAGRALDVARTACDRAVQGATGAARGNFLDSRGLVNLKQGRTQQAWNDYDAAVRENPNSAHFLYGRGVSALRLGRGAEGRADIERAAQMDPGVAQAYASYGVEPASVSEARPTVIAPASPPSPPRAAPGQLQASGAFPPEGRRAYSFYCSNNQTLRIIFDSERQTATVTRIRAPDVRLRRAPSAPTEFRYTDGSYELSGTLASVQWRAGSGEPITCNDHRGQ